MNSSKREALELLYLAQQQKIKRKAKSNLLDFILYTKSDYEIGWHHKLMCEFVDRFIKSDFTRGMIFCPPRHGKSEIVSRRLPAFIHGLNPNAEIMMATYNASLAADMAIDLQRIVDRPAYKELFPLSQITPEGSISKYARNSLEYELIPVKLDSGEIFYPKGSFRAQGIGGSF